LGVELAGAMKNVMAIAAGPARAWFGAQNSVAAAHHPRAGGNDPLAMVLAKPETLSGLAEWGDLILTCYGAKAQPPRGFELGRGRSLAEILAGMTMSPKEWAHKRPCWHWHGKTGSSSPSPNRFTASCTWKFPREAIRAIRKAAQTE